MLMSTSLVELRDHLGVSQFHPLDLLLDFVCHPCEIFDNLVGGFSDPPHQGLPGQLLSPPQVKIDLSDQEDEG